MIFQAIGRAFLPPYWSLGFQLSRWGYNKIETVKSLVENMRKHNLPQVCCCHICFHSYQTTLNLTVLRGRMRKLLVCLHPAEQIPILTEGTFIITKTLQSKASCAVVSFAILCLPIPPPSLLDTYHALTLCSTMQVGCNF